MIRSRMLSVVAGLGLGAVASAQVEVNTVLETYFLSWEGTKGFAHALSWGETNIRFDPRIKATFSYTRMPTRQMYDEACLSFDVGTSLVRVGRIRTAFGFSDWSENFYNGFNHRALVRSQSITDSLRLNRDDAGVEVTLGGPNLQVQAALIDDQASSYQLLPDKIEAGTLRLQSQVGDVLVGLDYLGEFEDKHRVVGADLRWTTRRLLVRAETYAGDGGKRNFSGYYIDGAYRIPHLTRTQLVARTEKQDTRSGAYQVHTLGLRQVFNDLAINLNYGWIEGLNPGTLGTRAPERWSMQAMYRVSF